MPVDLNALREAAIEATARALHDRHGIVPIEDSEEWEAEYRRQFARLKEAGGSAAVTVAPRAPGPSPATERRWPELNGTPEQKRWAATIRAERFREIASEPLRVWLAQGWTRAKWWIDMREVPTAVLVERLRPQYEEHRREAAERARARAAEAQQKAAAAAAHQARLEAAGITPAGLVELIDASERTPSATIREKLAEIAVDGRTLRIFETADPNILLVKEKNREGQADYGIERDRGLVADLKLFAQTL